MASADASDDKSADKHSGSERAPGAGDTVRLDDGRRVRLIGIDTPETVHPDQDVECYGPEASDATAALLPPGTPVRLEYDQERTDPHGRTLAYVHRLDDALFLNGYLLEEGYATVAIYPPNDVHENLFREHEAAAAAEGAGLWSACAGGRP